MSKAIQIRACRVCMETKDGNLLNLCSNHLEEKFHICFNIKVSEIKFGPNFICNVCADVVTNFAAFKQKCLQSEAFWRKTYKPDLNIYSRNVKNDDKTVSLVEDSSHNQSSVFIEVMKIKQEIEDEVESNDGFEQNNELQIKNNLNYQQITDAKINFKFERLKTSNKGKKYLKKFVGQCSGCKKRYLNKQLMISHLKRCPKIVDPLKVKKPNIKQRDKSVTTKYYCGLCEMSTDCTSTLSTHMEGHEKSSQLTCSQCDFKGLDLADFMAHRFEHQPAGLKTFICHKCPRKFRVIIKYEFHYRRAHLQDIPGRCRFCDKTYTNYKMWKYHVNSHSVQPTFECDVCGRVYHVKHMLTQHMRSHTDIKKLMCDLCGFSTRKSYDLKSHIRAVHEVRKALPCEICGKLYKNLHGLRLHMRMRHLENKFTCVVCGKCYPSEKMLKTHEIWHCDVRPFECHLCDKAFKSRSNLDEHVRAHNHSKAFCCDVCLKSFTTNKLLKMHQRRNSHFIAADKVHDSVF